VTLHAIRVRFGCGNHAIPTALTLEAGLVILNDLLVSSLLDAMLRKLLGYQDSYIYLKRSL
jgi:hypothetical protein